MATPHCAIRIAIPDGDKSILAPVQPVQGKSVAGTTERNVQVPYPCIVVLRDNKTSLLNPAWLGPSYAHLIKEFLISEPPQRQAHYLALLTQRVARLANVPITEKNLAGRIYSVKAEQETRSGHHSVEDETIPRNSQTSTASVVVQIDRNQWFCRWLNEPVPSGHPIMIEAKRLPSGQAGDWAQSLGVPTLLQVVPPEHINSELHPFWKRFFERRKSCWMQPETAERIRKAGVKITVHQAGVFERLWTPAATKKTTPYANVSPAWGLSCEAAWMARREHYRGQWEGVWQQARWIDALSQIVTRIPVRLQKTITGTQPGRLQCQVDQSDTETLGEMANAIEPFGGYVITAQGVTFAAHPEPTQSKPEERGRRVLFEKAQANRWDQVDQFALRSLSTQNG